MIFYGSKTKEIASEATTEKCSQCGTQNSIQLSVFQKYAHVYWLPFFPMSKIGISECSHCKHSLEEKDFDQNLKSIYSELKSKSSTPIWTYVGLVLLALLIVFLVYENKNKDEKNSKVILEPKIGDVYDVKLDEKTYTLYKIIEVAKDSVYYTPSSYETSSISGLRDIKEKNEQAFSEDVYVTTKSELKSMFEKEQIIDITRK